MVTPSTNQTYGLVKSANKTVARVRENRINVPPIVGVPALLRCAAGPSERMGWPALSAVRRAISHGPRIKDTLRANKPANRVLNVI